MGNITDTIYKLNIATSVGYEWWYKSVEQGSCSQYKLWYLYAHHFQNHPAEYFIVLVFVAVTGNDAFFVVPWML